ncbi:MAG: hypothetical protein KAS94_06190 [Desulfobulbaceae bacterium]|nr:hypothetical protein [Desulfobulbaceae bacterium]
MENLVEELRKVVSFKNSTEIGDIVLIAIDTPRSLLYARVKDFERDDSRRDEWWHISLQLLTVPPQEVKWTLRLAQFTGQETFTMGGDQRFIQAVDLNGIQPDVPDDAPGDKDKQAKPKLQLLK